MRAIFFDEYDARAVLAALEGGGWTASLSRDRLAGEDDDEDHPWAVATDAPEPVLDLLVDAHDGWLERDSATPASSPRPLDLPDAPRRRHHPPS